VPPVYDTRNAGNSGERSESDLPGTGSPSTSVNPLCVGVIVFVGVAPGDFLDVAGAVSRLHRRSPNPDAHRLSLGEPGRSLVLYSPEGSLLTGSEREAGRYRRSERLR
jgi:hypothetical protein